MHHATNAYIIAFLCFRGYNMAIALKIKVRRCSVLGMRHIARLTVHDCLRMNTVKHKHFLRVPHSYYYYCACRILAPILVHVPQLGGAAAFT